MSVSFCRARLLCPLASKCVNEKNPPPPHLSPVHDPSSHSILPPDPDPQSSDEPYRLVDAPSSKSATRTPNPDTLSLAYIYVTATSLHSRPATKPSGQQIQPPIRHRSSRAPRNQELNIGIATARARTAPPPPPPPPQRAHSPALRQQHQQRETLSHGSYLANFDVNIGSFDL
ncbi:hypothetical protein K432DRAFT_103235 [Lepidopterella palustris CBS 459.81]|uniref:Uncharacterized protein n=1 Tax=Lepidopterella palustris CBS 459.81 TaxID=1314670 RepID=A0A8E2E647_9PEZI|nr:hypothetical protein K432DRAFT_103235 [Lepidopterella palustris CBS 459.81]